MLQKNLELKKSGVYNRVYTTSYSTWEKYNQCPYKSITFNKIRVTKEKSTVKRHNMSALNTTWPLFWNNGTTVIGGLKSNTVQTDWNLLLFRKVFCFQFSCGNLNVQGNWDKVPGSGSSLKVTSLLSVPRSDNKVIIYRFSCPVQSWTGKHMKNTKLNSSWPFNCRSGRGHCTIKWCTLKISHYVHVQANILHIAVNFLCYLLDRVMHCFTDKQQGIHHNWVVRGPLLISATQSRLLTI